jgi:cytochrome c oxidase subunit 4
MSGHIVPKRVYFLVFAILIALTALTTGVAFINLGPLNTVAALAIAVSKALLVILFFMHIKYSPDLTRLVVVAGFFWLAILLALTLSDFLTRNWTPAPTGWESSQVLPSLVESGRAHR